MNARQTAINRLRVQSSRWPLPWTPAQRLAVAFALASILVRKFEGGAK